MNVKVKICGIRSVEIALAAVGAGAEFIGLNFVPTSKRKVTVEQAKEIAKAIKGRANIVGVFQNAEVSYVNETTSMVGLDFVQLHGNETPEYCGQITTEVIKAVSLKGSVDAVVNEMNTYSVPYFLLDRVVQGVGKPVDLSAAEQIAREFEIFLAGGLTPENVKDVVQQVRPFAVDVAGGIETDGHEDVAKIKQFVMNAKGVNI